MSKKPGLTALNFENVVTKPELEQKERGKSSFELDRDSKSARGFEGFVSPNLALEADKERLEELRINNVKSRPVSARSTNLGTIRDTEQNKSLRSSKSFNVRQQRGRSKTARTLAGSDNSASKIGIVGYPGVGKSYLAGFIANGIFPESIPYTQSSVLPVKRRGLFVNTTALEIVDFSNGTEDRIMENPRSRKYRDIPIYLIVYSVKSIVSFETASQLLESISSSNPSTKLILVGTNCLTELREVTEQASIDLAARFSISRVEVDIQDQTNFVELETFIFKHVNNIVNKQEKKTRTREQSKEILAYLASAIEVSILGLEIDDETAEYEFTSLMPAKCVDSSQVEILCYKSYMLIRHENNLESYSLENGVRAGLGLDELNPNSMSVYKKRLYFINEGDVECWALSLTSSQFTYHVEGANINNYVMENDKLFCGTDSGRVVVFNMDTEEPTVLLDLGTPIDQVFIHEQFLYVSTNEVVSKWELENNTQIFATPVGFDAIELSVHDNLLYCRNFENIFVMDFDGQAVEPLSPKLKIEKRQRLPGKLKSSRSYAKIWVDGNTVCGVLKPSE